WTAARCGGRRRQGRTARPGCSPSPSATSTPAAGPTSPSSDHPPVPQPEAMPRTFYALLTDGPAAGRVVTLTDPIHVLPIPSPDAPDPTTYYEPSDTPAPPFPTVSYYLQGQYGDGLLYAVDTTREGSVYGWHAVP